MAKQSGAVAMLLAAAQQPATANLRVSSKSSFM